MSARSRLPALHTLAFVIVVACCAPARAQWDPECPMICENHYARVLTGTLGATVYPSLPAPDVAGAAVWLSYGEQWTSGIHPLVGASGAWATGLFFDPVRGTFAARVEVIGSLSFIGVGAGIGYRTGQLWSEGPSSGLSGGPSLHLVGRLGFPIPGDSERRTGPETFVVADVRPIGTYQIDRDEIRGDVEITVGVTVLIDQLHH